MMYPVALWLNIIIFAKIICTILASTHWIVTDEGFIQPILDSPFHLKVPSDLLTFMEQENRLSEIHAIYQHFLERKLILEHALFYSLNEAQHIQKKYKANDHCLLTKNKKFKDIDLSISFTSDGSDGEGISLKDFHPNDSHDPNISTDVPDCKNLFTLPFSMVTFDHLQDMKDGSNLTIPKEPALHEWLIPGFSLQLFGHQLNLALVQNSSSWLHYNLATIFWRINGNASNALECSRRAVYFAPREYKDVALLNMGSIFYQAQRYLDAIIIFHAAVDHAPFAAVNHFILGNAYANIAEFDKSASCYKNVLELKPDYEQALMNQNMMMCYAFRVMEILDIHNAIEEMRNAFEEYHGVFSKWQATGIKALNIQSSLSVKIMDNPNVMFTNTENLQKNTFPSTMADKKIFKYSLLQNHNMFSTDLFGMLQASSDLYKTVDSFQNQINEISNNYELSENYLLIKKSQDDSPDILENPKKIMSSGIKAEANDDSVIVVSFLKTIYKGTNDSDKTINGKSIYSLSDEKDSKSQIKYPRDKMEVSRIKYDFDKNNDWPSMEECEEWTPANAKMFDGKGNIKKFPVYLPVDNKGYSTPKIVSDYIRVDLTIEHTLPWYPPTCPSKSLLNVAYLPEGLKIKSKHLPQFPDDEQIIRNTLIYNIYGDLTTGKHFQEAEIGQRIYMAMKMEVAPKWVLYTLSSLYWRVRKNVGNTLDCLVGALEDTPQDTKDVPLISLASVLFELGYDEDAFKLANEAHYINMFEPSTNFLLSLIHNKNNHILGQMYHIRQTVRVDEQFMMGKAYQLLKAWSCQTKFSIQFQETATTEEKSESLQVHVLSKEGIILSMICTTLWDGQSCHPSNVFVYEGENGKKGVSEDGVIPLMITEEKSLAKIYISTVDFFTKSVFRINLMLEDTLFQTSVPLMRLMESTIETKDGKLLFKNDITSSATFVVDKNGYQKELDKFSILRPSDGWYGEVLEWIINDKQVLFHISNDICSKLKFPDNLFSSKQIWNLFLNRFPTLNQIITPFETTGSWKPQCQVSNTLTPDSDMLGWHFNTPKKVVMCDSNDRLVKLLRKLMGGTNASLDKMGTMIAEAIKDHEESWILKVMAAIFYSAKGNPLTALSCMRQALILSPEKDKDIPLLGLSALSFWINSLHDAAVYSKFAYEIHPNFAAGPFFIGFILTFAKREHEALLMLRKAYTIDMDLTIIEDIVKYIVCNMKNNSQFESIFDKIV